MFVTDAGSDIDGITDIDRAADVRALAFCRSAFARQQSWSSHDLAAPADRKTIGDSPGAAKRPETPQRQKGPWRAPITA